MAESKYFDRAAAVVTALTLVLTILFMNGAALGVTAVPRTMGYETRLFDSTEVHSIDIVMDNWEELIENAEEEAYYPADVVIDGEAYKNIGIRAKGNTSLSTVAALGSERYSFKLEFDHYDSATSYHGLDKLSLNNLIQDSTMMKDYLTYTMMGAFGVNASLCSYVYITVNGEDWGLYLAVEGVEEAFLERNYGTDCGALYKPDSTSFGGGRGNGGDFNMDGLRFDFGEIQAANPGSTFSVPGESNPPTMPGGEMSDAQASGEAQPGAAGSFDAHGASVPAVPSGGNHENSSGIGSSDVKLQYIDDEISSYTNIWNNAKTDIGKADKTRLIASLKKLSSNEDISSVVDIEQVIRYFVVHNFVCNDDSYTGTMVHNYYLYEKDGKLSMLPWDYNLAYGTFGSGNATETVNTPIDAPVSGGSADRPMINWIFENEEYLSLYHQYFSEFLNSVDVEGIIQNAYHLIGSYVVKDPTAFYTSEEFEVGVATLLQFCSLRSESISMQLETGDTASNMRYVDASAITLSDMGSMGGNSVPGRDDSGEHGEAFSPGSVEDSGSSPLPDGFSGTFPGHAAGNENDGIPSEGAASSGAPAAGSLQWPEGKFSPDGATDASIAPNTMWIWLAVSAGVLVIGLLVVKKYRA